MKQRKMVGHCGIILWFGKRVKFDRVNEEKGL